MQQYMYVEFSRRVVSFSCIFGVRVWLWSCDLVVHSGVYWYLIYWSDDVDTAVPWYLVWCTRVQFDWVRIYLLDEFCFPSNPHVPVPEARTTVWGQPRRPHGTGSVRTGTGSIIPVVVFVAPTPDLGVNVRTKTAVPWYAAVCSRFRCSSHTTAVILLLFKWIVRWRFSWWVTFRFLR